MRYQFLNKLHWWQVSNYRKFYLIKLIKQFPPSTPIEDSYAIFCSRSAQHHRDGTDIKYKCAYKHQRRKLRDIPPQSEVGKYPYTMANNYCTNYLQWFWSLAVPPTNHLLRRSSLVLLFCSVSYSLSPRSVFVLLVSSFKGKEPFKCVLFLQQHCGFFFAFPPISRLPV